MTLKTKNDLSVGKALLAALWHTGDSGKEKLFSHRYIKSFCQDKSKITYRSSISRLCTQQFIKKDFNNIIGLTEKGRRAAREAFIKAELQLHKRDSGKWDGGWRMVTFDIPEQKRKHRDYLRKVLKAVGFHEFQKSIWIYPFPVPPFLKEVMLEENIKPYVRFITTNLIDDDADIKKVFDLA